MAGALPLILGGAAVLLIAGKKKKRKAAPTYEEPDVAPGAGAPTVFTMHTIPATLDSQATQEALTVARRAYPVERPKEEIDKGDKEVEKEKKEKPKEEPPRCSQGTLTPDRKYVCWGVGKLRKMRRVPKYRTAQMTAASLAALGPAASTMLKSPNIQFLLWAWVNRNKGLYKCTRRYRFGKKRCNRWNRY